VFNHLILGIGIRWWLLHLKKYVEKNIRESIEYNLEWIIHDYRAGSW
jgi:hypothetical protein